MERVIPGGDENQMYENESRPYWGTTAAYMVSPQGAQKLLQMANKRFMSFPDALNNPASAYMDGASGI